MIIVLSERTSLQIYCVYVNLLQKYRKFSMNTGKILMNSNVELFKF